MKIKNERATQPLYKSAADGESRWEQPAHYGKDSIASVLQDASF
jgi:hypothetical protein